MPDNSLILLEMDWSTLVSTKNWADAGKCLRALVKVHKNSGQLSHKAYEIEQQIKVLEHNLNAVDPRTRFAIIGDILYARRAVNGTATDEFGSAFKPVRVKR
jgi:hypothetical protein